MQQNIKNLFYCFPLFKNIFTSNLQKTFTYNKGRDSISKIPLQIVSRESSSNEFQHTELNIVSIHSPCVVVLQQLSID